MNNEAHPIIRYIRSSKPKETITSFCGKVGISRTHLYRVMKGEPTTTRTLQAISEATGGKVSVMSIMRAGAKQLEAAE